MKALKQYARKRNFSKTPEPAGVVKRSRTGHSYVIQKHDASHLHYDFRLELDGVLKSWAVPKGPSLDPADKRLAVEVEDHPLDYGGFEGTIPKGQYGGGTVMLWDRGTWESLDPDANAAWKKGRMHFALHGEKLKGEWTLTRMAWREGQKNNWLLMKRQDRYARKGGGEAVVAMDRSIKTGRGMEEIAVGKKGSAVWTSGRERKVKAARGGGLAGNNGKPTSRAKAGAGRAAARANDLPRNLTPQLCTLADKVPAGDEWIHEIKLDGYRLLAIKNGDEVRLMTRAGHDWTAKFRPIAHAIGSLKARSVVLDGEAVVTDPRGKSSFQLLQKAIKAQKFGTLALIVFDLLAIDGTDLRPLPLMERKLRLAEVFKAQKQDSILRLNEYIEGDGSRVQEHACRLGLEGMVSKLKAAPYTSGRSRTWIKVKCGRRQEFVIVGWTSPSGVRRHFGSLLLAAHDAQGRLVYTGKVGTGFDAAGLKDISDRMKAITVKASPLDVKAPASEVRGAVWVRPALVAEIAFTEWTDDGRLRHPSFQGLREDKPASKVKVEVEAPVQLLAPEAERQAGVGKRTGGRMAAKKQQTKNPPARKAEGDIVAGIRITHPDRVVYPDCGVTKIEVARYYESIAEWMMPYVTGRPLSVVRCTSGTKGGCFFQKHPGAAFGPPVKAVPVRDSGGIASYISINSTKGLISLVQMGVLELHPWGSKAATLEKPDTIIFDLDPDPGVPLARLKQGAERVREVLNGVGLKSWLKTSGGKGLHVVVPLRSSVKMDWDTVKEFAAGVAKGIAAQEPSRYIATASKAKRKGKIFIDWLRNGRGATSVAPYSTRARPGAPVSMPIAWEELDTLKDPAQFTVRNALDHIQSRSGDPWADLAPAAGLSKVIS